MKIIDNIRGFVDEFSDQCAGCGWTDEITHSGQCRSVR
jgi:hypothetical protein